VPVRAELLARVEALGLQQTHAVRKRLSFDAERVLGLARGLPRPQQLVANMAQTLDGMAERLQLALPQRLAMQREKLARLMAGLSPRYLQQMLQQQHQRVGHWAALLESLNVLSVLKRGFALVKNADQHLVTSVAAMPTSGAITVMFHDGERSVQLGADAASKPKKSKPKDTQPGLFD
jgi:exodeoxyribonuclease VII large subunit